MSVVRLAKPYLLMLGDEQEALNAKTAFGLRDWARADCVGQWRFSAQTIDLGLKDMEPMEAVRVGAKTLVVGIAPRGGALPQNWIEPLVRALSAGLDLAAGLHQRLAAQTDLAAAASMHSRAIFDVRHGSPFGIVATGKHRQGKRLLTVGTDCALGKKYTALALTRELKRRGYDCDFRATGQTGVLIAGEGIAIDAVVADFVAGAAEILSPDAAPSHWDIIEGQGALHHPSYAGVTLGLVHGSQPDAMVLCHDPSRSHLFNLPHMKIPSLRSAHDAYLDAARLTNAEARFVGVSMNTAAFDEEAARGLMKAAAAELELPCVDPMRSGVAAIADCITEAFPATSP